MADETLAGEQVASIPPPIPPPLMPPPPAGANLQVTDLGPETATNPKFKREMLDVGRDPAKAFTALESGHQIVDVPSPDATGVASAPAFDVMGQVDEAAPPPKPRVAVVTGPDGAKARVTIPDGASDEDIQASIRAVADHMAAKSPQTQPGAQLQPGQTMEMGTSEPPAVAPSPMSTEEAPVAPEPTPPRGVAATTTTPTTIMAPTGETTSVMGLTPEGALKPTAPPSPTFREQPVDEAGRAFNVAAGRDPTHWKGMYGAAMAKPFVDAMDDVVAAFTEVNKNSTGNPLELSTWADALDRSLKLLHPLGVVGEAAGNLVLQAANDAGVDPQVSQFLAFGAMMAGGAYTPGISGQAGPIGRALQRLPVVGRFFRSTPTTTKPLQGTIETRAAAAETGAAATQAEEALVTTRTAGEEAIEQTRVSGETAIKQARTAGETATEQARVAGEVGTEQARAVGQAAVAEARTAASQVEGLATQADEITTTARATADDMARKAEEAAAAVEPSPALRERAIAELAPSGVKPTAGSQRVAGELVETLEEEMRPAVKRIYDTGIANAEDAGKTTTPDVANEFADKLVEIRNYLGARLTGAPAQVFDDLERELYESGGRLTPKTVDKFFAQLGDLFPGRAPYNATPVERVLWKYKWHVRDVLRSMFEGEDVEWAKVADALTRDEIAGKVDTALGPMVRLAKKNMGTFVERIFGPGSSDKAATYAKAVLKHLDDAGAKNMQETVLTRAVDRATDRATGALDPEKLLGNVGKYSEEFYSTVVGKGQDTFLKALRKELADVGETALQAKRGAQWVKAAEGEGAAATTRAAKAAKAVPEAAEEAASGVAAAERLAKKNLGAAEREATKGLTTAEEEAATAQRLVEREAKRTGKAAEKVAGTARTAAEKAAEEAAKPNKFALVGALGIEFLAHKVASAMGLHPALQVAEATLGILGTKHIAKWLANDKMANLLARAIRTTADSPATIVIAEEIKKHADAMGWSKDLTPAPPKRDEKPKEEKAA